MNKSRLYIKMRKKLVLLIGIIGIVAISSFSIGYILISNSSPNDYIVLEYDYNVYPLHR